MRDETDEAVYALLNRLNHQWTQGSPTMKPEHVTHNEFLTNLGTDHVAVDERGVPIARASDRATLTRAAPGAAASFSGEDFYPPAAPVLAVPSVSHMPVPSAPAAPPVTPTKEPVPVMPIGDLPDTPKPDWSDESLNNLQPTGTPAKWLAQKGQTAGASNSPSG